MSIHSNTAFDLPYHQTDFTPEEFQRRRKILAPQLAIGSIAVLPGASGTGAFDIFRQTNEFYYLSGVEVPHSYLLIRCDDAETTLYLPHGDPHMAASEGKELNCDEPETVISLTGVDHVKPLSALADDVKRASSIYTPMSPGEARMQCRDMLQFGRRQRRADPWVSQQSIEELFRAAMVAVNPGACFRDLSPILDQMRIVKSSAEVDVMRRAGSLTALAVRAAMNATRPGVYEFQLGAIADYVYLVNGARGGGYRPIIAGGSNIWNGHYYRNSQRLKDGDLVLMDYAPDYGCYTSDIGRIWPVNGRYSAWQRELYGYIVEYHKVLLAAIRPGRTAQEIHSEAAETMRPTAETTNWSKPEFRSAALKTLEFKGHLSHPVGMAVHDVGAYHKAPISPGTVFALDPQMWIPEEQVYIRVEDTVVVTEEGVENLTDLAALDLDAVEAEVKGEGLLIFMPPALAACRIG